MQIFPKHYDAKMFIIIDKVSLLAIIIHIFLIGIFYWFDYLTLAVVNVFSTLMWIYGRNLNTNGNQPMAILVLTSEVIFHALAAVHLLGWESGFQFYLITALIFNIFRGDVKLVTTIATILFFLSLFIGLHLYTTIQTYYYETPLLFKLLYYNNIIMAFGVMSLIAFYFKQATTDYEKEIQERANTDYLTGLLTRRSLASDIDGDIRRSLMDRQESVVIMTDIDHFKKINDTYGHDCGDQVIKEISQRLKENLRYCDKIYRWGGEEFLIVLTNVSVLDAKSIAQSLRKDVESATFFFDNQEVHTSMTFGLACLNQQHSNIDDVIKKADQALYRGKENGRNCVILAKQNSYETVSAQHRNVLTSHAILSGN